MITKEQAEEMKAQIEFNYIELRKYHIQQLLDKHKLTAGCRFKLNGKTYQLLDFDGLCNYNDLRSYFPYLYARLVKKDGELGKVAQSIYISHYDNIELVN